MSTNTAIATKEHELLLKGELVRAVLSGRKTQTRTPMTVRNSSSNGHPAGHDWPGLLFEHAIAKESSIWSPTDVHLSVSHKDPPEETDIDRMPWFRIRPKWYAGDRLWVRETWGLANNDHGHDCLCYRADEEWIEPQMMVLWDSISKRQVLEPTECPNWEPKKWRPSIHMPRWASRIDLEITAVRAERIQSISIQDVWQEGIRPEGVAETAGDGEGQSIDPIPLIFDEFQKLWESIYPGSWARNDWVWVREFKQIEAPQ